MGAEAINAALIPKLLISIDPSGIPTFVDDDPMAVGDIAGAAEDEVLEAIDPQLLKFVESVGSGDENPDVLPVEVPLMDAVPDKVPFVDVVPLMPPPSKLEKVEVSAAIPELNVPG